MDSVVLEKRTKYMTEQIAKLNNKDLTMLDIGCGIGTIPYLLGSLGYKVTGIDLDPISIKDCDEKNKYPNVDFQVGNAETVEMQTKYDVVIATEIIEHAYHPDLVFKTIKKHMKEDGIGIVSVPNGYCLWELVIGRFIQKGIVGSWLYNSPKVYKKLTGGDTPFNSKNSFCFHINFFTFGRFKELIESNGFKIVNVGHPSLGIFPEWDFFRYIKRLECKISDYVPHFMAGGWIMVIEK